MKEFSVTKFPAPRSKTSLSLYHREGGTGRCVYEQQLLKEIARRSFVCKVCDIRDNCSGEIVGKKLFFFFRTSL